jgi:hypothetical protein
MYILYYGKLLKKNLLLDICQNMCFYFENKMYHFCQKNNYLLTRKGIIIVIGRGKYVKREIIIGIQ